MSDPDLERAVENAEHDRDEARSTLSRWFAPGAVLALLRFHDAQTMYADLSDELLAAVPSGPVIRWVDPLTAFIRAGEDIRPAAAGGPGDEPDGADEVPEPLATDFDELCGAKFKDRHWPLGYRVGCLRAKDHKGDHFFPGKDQPTPARPAVSIPPTGSPLIPLAALLENLRAMESQPSCTDGSWRPSEDYLSAIQEVSRDAERLAALGWTTSNIPAPSPVVEQPEPAGQLLTHPTEGTRVCLAGYDMSSWERKGWTITQLYAGSPPVLPPLPDGTGSWVSLADVLRQVNLWENHWGIGERGIDDLGKRLAAAAVTHPHPTGDEET